MSANNLIDLTCHRCGGSLNKQDDDIYVCSCCGKTFEEQQALNVAEQLREMLSEQKQEKVANLRQLLWKETHKEFISNKEVERLCKDILKNLPDDFYANFYMSTCNKNKTILGGFLFSMDIDEYYDDIPDMLAYMLKGLKPEWTMAVGNFIERAYLNNDLELYHNYRTQFEKANSLIEEGVFEPSLPRDVFVAYSSQDMPKVEELVSTLEDAGLTCFVAARNLRHGSGAVENYSEAIKTAIDSCTCVVFVSSDNSRSFQCDAYKELDYIQKSNKNKPRVEYLIKNYSCRAAERTAKKFFKNLEWCTSSADVAERVGIIIMGDDEDDATESSVKDKNESAAPEQSAEEVQEQITEDNSAGQAEEQAEEQTVSIDETQETEEVVEETAVAEGNPEVDTEEQTVSQPAETEEQQIEQPLQDSSFEQSAEDYDINFELSPEQFNDGVKICKKCGTALNGNIKFCTNCGGNKFFTEFEQYRVAKIRYCAVCGRANEENFKCCPECGSNKFFNYYEHIKAVDALAESGIKEYNNGNYRNAAQIFQQAINTGNSAKAMYNLGICYQNGNGKDQNKEEAFKWYELAANQGYAPAITALGLCYKEGCGTIQNLEEAVKLYTKAANQGYADAQNRLGVCYSRGEGIEKNDDSAVGWYIKAAKQGHAKAQSNLGICYKNGMGIEKKPYRSYKMAYKIRQPMLCQCAMYFS